MKTKDIRTDKEPKTYKTLDEALEAKHDLAKKFIEKIGITKIATLGK